MGTKKCIANASNICVVSSAVILMTTIDYGTSSSSIDSSELFIWVFSHSIRGWLAGTSNANRCPCNREDTFSIDHDNLEKIQATNL